MRGYRISDKRICSKCKQGTWKDKRGYASWRFVDGEPLCSKCYSKVRITINPEKERKRYLDYRYRNKEACVKRAKMYYDQNKERLNKNRVQYYHDHQEIENMTVRESRRRNGSTSVRYRLGLISLLGGKCIYCAYDKNLHALYLDHINGGGRQHRLTFGPLISFYRYYVNNPDEAKKTLQVLCANCNAIKRNVKREYWFGGKFPRKMVTSS